MSKLGEWIAAAGVWALRLKPKVMLITPERFAELTGVVIDNFEGGYYHPNMKLKMKPSDAAKMGDSGETMFGLDRKHGSQLAVYDGWKEFWYMIDESRRVDPTAWKHYFLGGQLNKPLKEYTSKIMYQWFSKLAGKYLNEQTIALIDADDRLIIHFSYASWNGEGWFKRFADVLKKATGDKEQTFQTAIKARTQSSNKVIAQQGANMMALFKRMNLV